MLVFSKDVWTGMDTHMDPQELEPHRAEDPAESKQARRRTKMQMLVLTLAGAGIGLLMLGIFVALTQSKSGREATGPQSPLQVGQPAPNFEVITLDGRKLALSDLKGQPVWINFWASWCVPCKAEMPEVVRTGKEAKARGVRLIAIDVGEPAKTVRDYLRRSKYDSLPAALDETGEASTTYKVYNFPTHVFIDSQGILRRVNIGMMQRSDLEEALQDLK